MDNFPAQTGNLSSERQKLFELLLKQKGIKVAQVQAIPQRTTTEPCPLSFAQQRLWFLDRLEPGSTTYNMPTAVRLKGCLNVAALTQSLNAIVQRHEVLRTTFTTPQEGQPVQLVAPTLTITLPIVDLRSLQKTEAETEVLRLAQEEARQPFNLEQGPLLRGTLLQLGDAEYVALFTMHHIVSDGWSTGVFIRELTALYESFVKGKPPELTELPIQYADFAIWQRQQLQGEALESELAFWRRQLDHAPTALELPTDRPRLRVQSHRGATQSLVLPKTLTEALKALSQKEGTTLFVTLLAAFKALLYRYTGMEDLLVGTPIANRNRTELEGLIGFFANTLVLRTNLSGNPSFRDLLGRLREVTLEAYAHQNIPFEKLVEELQPERDLSRQPLFQVMFVLHNTPTEELNLSGLTLSYLKQESQTAKFDLTLSIAESESGLTGVFEYNAQLFDAATIARMQGHFYTLLEGIVANPNQRLSDLPLLTAAEKHQLLIEWNQTNTPDPQDICIDDLFEAQVERTPDAIAVVFEDQQLTYRELNARANQLAHYLQKLGVAPEVLVGICVERSLLMVIGVLGILKAGGAYVPLDPVYPKERLAFMLADTQAPVLLTQAQLVEKLPEHRARVICLDQNWEDIAGESQENPASHTNPDNLAYAIYTSGSTGKPKGIGLGHRPLVNLLQWHYSSLCRGARTLQFASLSFDASFHEMFAAWGTGGTLFILPEALRMDVVGLGRFLFEQAIEKAILPVVVLQQLAESVGEVGRARLQTEHFSHLRELTTTGEQLQITQPIVKLFGSLKHCSLHNHYGPSETHVVTALTLGKNPEEWPSHPPIGIPIANTQIYIVDQHFNPVPVGVTGELYIGGVSLARGYLNRPDLTAEKFIPNPFIDLGLGDSSHNPESCETDVQFSNPKSKIQNPKSCRLYKTGDLARFLPDGNIEYLGRIDHQVKLRGFRIELGEIEAVLSQHPMVWEALVQALEDESGNKRLVAYVVSERESALTEGDLRRFVQEKLPNYMVPSAFIRLDSLPLTPNGKVDRRALPVPNQTGFALEEVYTAPRTPVEEQLAEIFAQVLGVEQVSIHDNFFSLGGHSLLIAQLVFRVQQAFQVELPLRSLFELPTVASLAERIEIAHQTGDATIDPKTVVDLNAEAVLDATIRPEVISIERAEPTCIFLTGATGFIGAFLLSELLQQTHADIYCLVRSSNAEEGKKRIRSSLESYLLWDESLSPRIIPVVGDLSQPLLGLSEEQFQDLASQVNVIYHNGAWVHHTSPYFTLKAANVLGTQEVLRLASQTQVKPVHFISTTGVFSSTGHSGVQVVREQDSFDDYSIPSGGYAQSKWVAEKLLKIASDRGIPVCIYRLGRVSGHSQTGVFNQNDFLYRLIVGCIQLGSVPEEEMIQDMAPVDYISTAIVHLSRQEKALGKAFHFVNPQPFQSGMLINLIRSFGYPLQQISYDQWQTKLLNIAENVPDHTLYPLVPFFTARKSERKTSESMELKFDCQNTSDGLAGTSIVCPEIDEQLLRTYFLHLVHNGFLGDIELKV